MTERLYTLRLVQAVKYENDHQWNYPFNLYPFHTLYLVEGGDGFVKTENARVALRENMACLIPAYTLFSCWCESEIKKIYVEFFLDTPSGHDVFFEQGKVQTRAIDPKVMAGIRQLKPGSSLCDSMRLEGELLCILSGFINQGSARPAPELARLQPLLADIHARLGGDLNLGELAGRHGFSPSSLSHSFKRAFSCTPKQYVQQLLANVLKHQLLHTDNTLIQLAEENRFCDAYYLSNFFKRQMGVSPQHYRREVAQGVQDEQNRKRLMP